MRRPYGALGAASGSTVQYLSTRTKSGVGSAPPGVGRCAVLANPSRLQGRSCISALHPTLCPAAAVPALPLPPLPALRALLPVEQGPASTALCGPCLGPRLPGPTLPLAHPDILVPTLTHGTTGITCTSTAAADYATSRRTRINDQVQPIFVLKPWACFRPGR